MAQEQPAIIDGTLVKLLNLTQFVILCQGPKICNSLPAYVTCLQSFPSFKKKMVEFLLK